MSKISNTKQNRIKIKRLLSTGLSIDFLSKLNESGMNMLHNMVIKEQTNSSELAQDYAALSKAYDEISKKEEEMGNKQDMEEDFPDATVDGKKLKKDINGKKDVIDENDLEEGYDEDTIHPGEGEVTQDPHQVGPDTDDGFGNPKNDDDGMGMFEGVTKQHLIEKFASKAQARYFYAKSNEPGKEGKKWKKYTKEFSDDTEDFDSLPEKVEQDESIENTDPKMVENWVRGVVQKNSRPAMTKAELIRTINETEEVVSLDDVQTDEEVGLPDWLDFKSIFTGDAGAPSTSPGETSSPTIAPTKPGIKTPPKRRGTPYKPHPNVKPKPKAVTEYTKAQLVEAPPIDYGDKPERMAPDIEQKISTQNFPLGDNPAFPDVDADGIPDNFEELVASERFKEVVDNVKKYTGLEQVTQNEFMQLQMMLRDSTMKILQIESQNREELERLAVDLVRGYMSIPEDAVQFDAKIVGMGEIDMSGFQKGEQEQPSQQEMKSEEELFGTFEMFDAEKEKRRFINSLIQGSAKKGHYLYHMIPEKINAINPELLDLYGIMMSVNDLVYWIMSDETAQMMGQGGAAAGKEELDIETDPPTVKAEGISFPVLVHELIKGVMELLASQGLPSDPRKAEMVMKATDTLPAEIWDLRLGPVIWAKFRAAYPTQLYDEDKAEIQNYLFSEFTRMEPEDFFALAKEILSGSEEGKMQLERIVKAIIKDLQEDDYEESLDSEEPEPTPTPPKPRGGATTDLDMNDILDKIFNQGMGSLSPDELNFLQNQ
tara:strand:- start:52466 stop:54772 length:2307 start_codon:yes stop_codon:yes gene_type:complete